MGQTYSDLTSETLSTWDCADVQAWKKRARDIHQGFYLAYQGRQWDQYKADEYDLLRVKICFALFGLPQDTNQNRDTSGNVKLEEAYSQEQRDNADKIKDAILDVFKSSPNSALDVGIIFVSCKQESTEFTLPLFRIRTKIQNGMEYNKFVDSSCRVYESWTDWKNNNRLPMLKYCYPTRGFYSCSGEKSYKFDGGKSPDLEFGTSPACDLTSRVGRLLDTGSSVAGFASAGIAVASMFTPFGPVVLMTTAIAGGSSALYGSGRSVQRLVDKGSHGESLTDMESVLCGLTILTSPLHLATSGVNGFISAGARNGRIFTSTIRTGVTILNCTTLGLDSAMLVMGFINLADKYQNDQLSPLDVLQFSISVFFFTNTLIQPKTASGIIQKAQSNHFNDYKNNLSDADAQKAFDKFVSENNANMKEGAQVVKTINRIRDPNSFFKVAGQENATIRLGGRKGKTVVINNEVRINPNRFNQLSSEKGAQLMQMTKQFQRQEISAKEYNKYVNECMREERISFETRRAEAINKVAEMFKTDQEGLKKIKINNKEMFADLDGPAIDRIKTVFGDTARNYNKDIIDAAISVAADLKCENIHDVCAVVELVALECKGKPKSQLSTFLKDFQKNDQVKKQFVDGIIQDSIKAEEIMKNSHVKFKNSTVAAYHFRKHGHEFGTNLNMNVYLDDIPKDLFQDKYLFKDVYNQEGTGRVRTYANPDNFKFGVEIVTDSGKTVATVFSNEAFFTNWTEKVAAASQHLEFCRIQYDLPLPSVASFFEVFVNYAARDMGYAGIEGQVYKNGKQFDLKTFTAKDNDVDSLRELAEVLSSMS